MKLLSFKLVTLICEPVLVASVLELAETLGTTGFTTTQVNGQGSGNKNSGEIPNEKVKIEFVMKPDLVSEFMKTISEKYFDHYSVIVYASDISVLRAEKF